MEAAQTLQREPIKKQRKKWKKGLAWIVGIILVLILVIAIFVTVFTSRSLPQTEGSVTLKGLGSEVAVLRDGEGVPHLKATSLQDLYMAQGYVQAQDRLFQMDLARRQASGRLSEVVGEATIDTDKFFRTLGLRRAAEASLAIYGEESIQTLDWFAQGVNAYIEESIDENKLPLEFTLLGYEPELWTPIDSLTIGKYMAFDLGGHWQSQAFRYWALANFSEEKAKELFPSYPENAPTIIASYEDIDLDIVSAFAKAIIPPEDNGSNNWVVSGEKSESGKPLLANDPHLGLGTPSIWYQMHLETEEMNVSGVIFAGIPGIIVGHNDSISWGVTNTGPDVQDLYIEKRNPDDKDEFLYNDSYEKATIISEPIKVKDGKTVDYEVTITRHGPVISEFAHQESNETALALRWTALDATPELQAFLQINEANNWEEFETALEDFHAPMQNFMFASEDGTIAYKANGKLPMRKQGDGLLPVPGWTDEYEWEGFVPYDELPTVINPVEGYIATANNKVVGEEYPYHISNHWAQPYRYMRIEEFLEEKEVYSLEDMKDLQMDQKNLYAGEFIPILTEDVDSAKLSNTEKEALKLFTSWNYQDDKNLPQPLLYHEWMYAIGDVLFQEDIPEEALKLFNGKQSIVDEFIRKASIGEEVRWFEDAGGYNEVLTDAFQQAVKNIAAEFGGDPQKWKWGENHQLYFAHPLSGSSPVLEFIFNKEDPLPIGGSHVTVQAAKSDETGMVVHGAAWRYVNDTAIMTEAEHIIGPGQSGHFKSEWYDNSIKDWAEGEYHKTSLEEAEGEKLLLTP
ncbi:penicillin acylase family protein [Bacillus sp. 2205SS5-2]|uniref:penicillin acylase family protein n=1 Tax=Bacillus sp. 2205SS5-2 TaxID=3109031 RepID=UPI0030066B63